jgi:hypothetical protein
MSLPPDVIKILESEIDGIIHGTVTLTIHLRDNHPRFVIGRERSFLPDTLSKCVGEPCNSLHHKPNASPAIFSEKKE